MPAPLLALGALQVAGGLFSGISGKKAGDKAAKMAREVGRLRAEGLIEEANQLMADHTEQQRAVIEQMVQRTSMVEGMYSQSGLLMEGTPATALREQKSADQYNLAQADDLAVTQADRLQKMAHLEMMSAGSAANAYKTQGKTDFFSGLFKATEGGINAYQGLKLKGFFKG